jgi:hypothetical protein
MDELLALHPDRVFLRREALAFGYRDRDLNAARRDGVLTRVRHGAFTAKAVWDASDDLERHRLRSAAVLRSHGPVVALSHTSAAVEHGLRLWEPDLTRVHVTRLDGDPGRTTHDVVYHEGRWTPDDIVQFDDRLVMGAGRCALETATLHNLEQGVVVLDSALDLGLATMSELSDLTRRMDQWPFTSRLQIVMRLVRPGAQSVGESRSRYLCWSQHLPSPELQFEVYDGAGNLVGVTDFAWPDYRLLGEFDGKVKYGRYLRPGEDPGDAVFREKGREDALREVTGWLVIRLIWADLYRPAATAARIRQSMRRSLAAS